MKLTSAPSPSNARRFIRWSIPTALVSVLLGGSMASAVEKNFRFYQFESVRNYQDGDQLQMSEITFSHSGVLLNMNNRNGTGVNVLTVAITGGSNDPQSGEGAMKLADGSVDTKWFNNSKVPVTFDFGAPVTIDAYNFATANDSANRTPISWVLRGSNDGNVWTVIDVETNYPTDVTFLTYQAGFAIPETVAPVINYFEPYQAAIVKNGGTVGLTWSVAYGDDSGTTLSPPPVAVSPQDFAVLTPPSNGTTVYTLTSTKTGEGAAPSVSTSSSLTLRAVVGGTSTFRYVRFTPLVLRGPTNTVQLAEFDFFNQGIEVPISAVENPGGSNSAPDSTSGERVQMLVDGDTNTKWLDNNKKPVIFDFGSSVPFDAYQFNVANDVVDRDPVRWVLEGSDDKVSWTLIENINYTFPTPVQRFFDTGRLPLPGPSIVPVVNFTGNATAVFPGDPLVLTWNTQGAQTVEITELPGALGSQGDLVVNPTEATTYTLTAVSSGGVVTTATFQVQMVDSLITTIAYDNFNSAGSELGISRDTTLTNGRLRLTPNVGGKIGDAWFRKAQAVGTGFETTFGLHLNKPVEGYYYGADGLCFTVQNSTLGSAAQGTGENGLPSNALNIKFDTWKNDGDPSYAAVQVRAGETVLGQVDLGATLGVDLDKPFPIESIPTLTSRETSAPYKIRITYVPGDLDVYFDGVQVLQNLNVDLGGIGAMDASGNAFVGFTARTGGNSHASDITSWHLKSGNFSALPAFGLVKQKVSVTTPTEGDFLLIWNSFATKKYTVQRSSDLQSWTPVVSDLPGKDAQWAFGAGFARESKTFFRILEQDL